MSPLSDTPDEVLHRRAADELPAHALGEPLAADIASHVDGCTRCREDVDAYRSVTSLARTGAVGAQGAAAARPPAHVWARITDELDLAASEPRTLGVVRDDGTVRVAPRRRSRHAARALLVAAAVAVAGLGGWWLGQRDSGSSSDRTATAALAAQRGTAASVHGEAVMRRSADGYQMQLTTRGLPAPTGYYEVWLYDPSANKMVAIGALGTDARGSFTVPSGIDTRAYHVVDVSNQRYDGNPAHQTSVLRGALGT